MNNRPVGVLGGAVTGDEGTAEVVVTVPAGLARFARAEVRRLDGAPVLDPLAGVPALAMVAMTEQITQNPHQQTVVVGVVVQVDRVEQVEMVEMVVLSI